MPASTCLRRGDRALDALVERDRRRARRARQAFLQARRGGVDASSDRPENPCRRASRSRRRRAARRSGGRARRSRRAAAPWWSTCRRARCATSFGRCALIASSTGPAANTVPHSVSMVATSAPQRAGDLAQQVAEAAEHRHQHAVAGLDQRDQDRLDAGARRAVDQERPAVAGLEQPAQQRHGLVHVAGELRVELPEQRHRHRAGTRGSTLIGPGPINSRGSGSSSPGRGSEVDISGAPRARNGRRAQGLPPPMRWRNGLTCAPSLPGSTGLDRAVHLPK